MQGQNLKDPDLLVSTIPMEELTQWYKKYFPCPFGIQHETVRQDQAYLARSSANQDYASLPSYDFFSTIAERNWALPSFQALEILGHDLGG